MRLTTRLQIRYNGANIAFGASTMRMSLRHAAFVISALVVLGASPGLAADARQIHERILTLDTHLDTPMNFSRPGWDIMEAHTVADDLSQVDYPRMIRGGLDGGFFAIFTNQGPRTERGFANARMGALKRVQEIHDMVARHGDRFALAVTADDAPRIAGLGKRFVFMSI